MKLIFERGAQGQHLSLLPACDVPEVSLSQERSEPLPLPHLSESQLSRHYTELSKQVYGVNDGFYPLGSCTMKYNPKLNDRLAALPGFTQVHPLQPEHTVQGCLQVLNMTEQYLCEITGMDAMTFQPAAGAHGELTGLLLIKKYHLQRGGYRTDQDHRARFGPRHQSCFGYDGRIQCSESPIGCGRLRQCRSAARRRWTRHSRYHADQPQHAGHL